MNEWLSMIPVSGECSAATQFRAGSMARAAAPSIMVKPSTPLIAPCLRIASTLATSVSSVATISLPHLRCGTPCEAQNSYSMRRPRTQCRARNVSVG